MSPSSDGERRPRSIAINIGANSTLPGVRGRLWPSGAFEYIPIPERKPTADPVPTYNDLGIDVPDELADDPVHLDPCFAEYPCCDSYTYGDEHPVKAGPLTSLRSGDYVWFYASLEPVNGGPAWAPPRWGAFVIGMFRLAVDPVDQDALDAADESVRRRCERNAHFRRADPDAKVILLGEPVESRLLTQALPLSTADAGTEANAYVTVLAGDSGAGPWWRRVLRFDPGGTERLRDAVDTGAGQPEPRLGEP